MGRSVPIRDADRSTRKTGTECAAGVASCEYPRHSSQVLSVYPETWTVTSALAARQMWLSS